MEDCHSSFDIYRKVDLLLRRRGIKPGEAMLEGFSRGSANIYALAALDRTKGLRYFSLFVANAGGALLDYPPTRRSIAADSAACLQGLALDHLLRGARPSFGAGWLPGHAAYR